MAKSMTRTLVKAVGNGLMMMPVALPTWTLATKVMSGTAVKPALWSAMYNMGIDIDTGKTTPMLGPYVASSAILMGMGLAVKKFILPRIR